MFAGMMLVKLTTMREVKRWIFMGFSVWILLFIAQLQFYIQTLLPNPLSRMDLLNLRPFNSNTSKDTYTNPYNFSDRILSELLHSVDQSKVKRVCDPEVEGWPPQRLKNFGERYLHPNKNASLLLPTFFTKPKEKKLSLICILKLLLRDLTRGEL